MFDAAIRYGKRVSILGTMLGLALGASPLQAGVSIEDVVLDQAVPIGLGAVCVQTSRTHERCTSGVRHVRVTVGVLGATAYPEIEIGQAGTPLDCPGLNFRADVGSYSGGSMSLRVELTGTHGSRTFDVHTTDVDAEDWEYVSLCQGTP